MMIGWLFLGSFGWDGVGWVVGGHVSDLVKLVVEVEVGVFCSFFFFLPWIGLEMVGLD